MVARSAFFVVVAGVLAGLPPAAGAAEDLAVAAARIAGSAREPVVVVTVENRAGAPRAVVGVRVAGAPGILEIRGRSGWEPIPALKIPGHAELRMDPERGPRVRLPPGPPPVSAPLVIRFDDGRELAATAVRHP